MPFVGGVGFAAAYTDRCVRPACHGCVAARGTLTARVSRSTVDFDAQLARQVQQGIANGDAWSSDDDAEEAAPVSPPGNMDRLRTIPRHQVMHRVRVTVESQSSHKSPHRGTCQRVHQRGCRSEACPRQETRPLVQPPLCSGRACALRRAPSAMQGVV